MMDVLSGIGAFGVPLLVLAGLLLLAILVIVVGRRARRRGKHELVAGHRLAVVDQVQIDDARRLVLIQRDEVQHLVILGGGSDFLVESGIGAARPAVDFDEPRAPRREPAPAPRTAPQAPPAPLPEPRSHEPRPAPQRAPETRLAEAPARPDEALTRPAPLPPPLAAPRRPVPASSPSLADIVDEPSAVAPTVPMRAEPVLRAPSATTPAPSEPPSRTSVKIDPAFAGMAEELEEVLRRPITADEPARRASPPVAAPSVAAPARAPAAPFGERPVPPVAPPRAPVDSAPITAASEPSADPFGVAAPEPRIAPAGSEPVPEIRAPEVRPSDLRFDAATEYTPADYLPAEPKSAERVTAGRTTDSDPFEDEMANILGRARRP